VISDPAANEIKAAPQTVHPLNFRRLSVMVKAALSMNDQRCMMHLWQVYESARESDFPVTAPRGCKSKFVQLARSQKV
jgi:hypothetical protein